jgi:hypothetical protein
MPGGSPTLRICEIGGRVRLGLEGFGHVEANAAGGGDPREFLFGRSI